MVAEVGKLPTKNEVSAIKEVYIVVYQRYPIMIIKKLTVKEISAINFLSLNKKTAKLNNSAFNQ
jgi:hypothetical protein